MTRQLLIPFLIMTLAWVSHADDSSLDSSFSSLGKGSEQFMMRARKLNPDNQVKIVQKRKVDRNLRFEIGAFYGGVAGGDTYVNTSNIGGQLEFHVNPKISLGVRYYESLNELTAQGRSLFEEAQRQKDQSGISGDIVDVAYPLTTTMATISYYPLYGKLNLFDQAVSQFDLYTLAGYGEVQTNQNSSPTYTVGGGIGFWITQYFSTRFEARYQSYQDEVYTGERNLDLTVFTFGMGLML